MSTSTAPIAREHSAAPPLQRAGARVPEAVYWARYYECPDIAYEWNNGRLEEKPVSDHLHYFMFDWFVDLLRRFLSARPIATTLGLETGFRLNLSGRIVIRKPDLAVVRHDNPVPLNPTDRSYHGVFDLCVEVLSDSKPAEVRRDTETKKDEYEAGGVKEYLIIHSGAHQGLYRCGPGGVYQLVPPDAAGIVRSAVLPGFRYRPADFHRRPSLQEMAEDPVYQAFVLPEVQRMKAAAEQARVRAQQAERRTQQAERQTRQAERQAQQAEQRAQSEIQTWRVAEADVARMLALLQKKGE